MRHRVAGYKLGRKTAHRRAMWRNMAVSLFTHGQITTTLPKARSVQPFVEQLITMAKKGDLASRRRVIAAMGDRIMVRGDDDENVTRNRYGEIKSGPKIVKHLFEEVAPRYADRPGGCTRIIKLARHRIGDAADLCVLQLVGEGEYRPKPGTNSRRRQQADHRMEFAARLRKAGGAAAAAEQPSEPAAEPEQAEPSPAEGAEGESKES